MGMPGMGTTIDGAIRRRYRCGTTYLISQMNVGHKTTSPLDIRRCCSCTFGTVCCWHVGGVAELLSGWLLRYFATLISAYMYGTCDDGCRMDGRCWWSTWRRISMTVVIVGIFDRSCRSADVVVDRQSKVEPHHTGFGRKLLFPERHQPVRRFQPHR